MGAVRSAKIILSHLQEIVDVCRQIIVVVPSLAFSEHISDYFLNIFSRYFTVCNTKEGQEEVKRKGVPTRQIPAEVQCL